MGHAQDYPPERRDSRSFIYCFPFPTGRKLCRVYWLSPFKVTEKGPGVSANAFRKRGQRRREMKMLRLERIYPTCKYTWVGQGTMVQGINSIWYAMVSEK